MKSTYVFFLILVTAIRISAARYPFPQNKVLYGIKATGDASTEVQSVYESWLSGYYEEEDSLARITWDTKDKSVSEGIGYGMLIMVCMDNAQNNTRPKFDKLWRYYKKFRNSNGLMAWQINGFSDAADNCAATDGDLDVATALVLAYRQWNDPVYRTDAQELLHAIWQSEINSNHYIAPGDCWDFKKNPSYLSTGAMQLFASVDTNDWTSIISTSFTLLNKVCDTGTGLPPDWCSQDGEIEGNFGWEALRVPWRMAWAYSWYGQQNAAQIDNKIIRWIRRITQDAPSAIKALYSLDGIPEADANAAFTGALTCAGLISDQNQEWVDAGLLATKTALANTYYKKSLQVLFMLLITGNFSLMSNNTESTITLSPVVRSNISKDYRLFITASPGTYFSINGKKIMKHTTCTLQPLIRQEQPEKQ